MKTLLIAGLLLGSVSLFAQTAEATKEETTTTVKKAKSKKKAEAKKVEATTAAPAKGLEGIAKKPTEPCDTKEDVLKKLEEEKKKQKAFSLQGGNTGCSLDEKK